MLIILRDQRVGEIPHRKCIECSLENIGEYKMFSFFWMITSWVYEERHPKKWQMYSFLGTGLPEEQHRQDYTAYWWMGFKFWWSRVNFSIKSCYDGTWSSVIRGMAWLTRGVLLWGMLKYQILAMLFKAELR